MPKLWVPLYLLLISLNKKDSILLSIWLILTMILVFIRLISPMEHLNLIKVNSMKKELLDPNLA